MASKHKTAKGIAFDMESFSQKHSKAIALGNMSTNARGDVLGKGGKVEIKREEVVRQYYREAPQQTVDTSIKETAEPVRKKILTPEEALKEFETATVQEPEDAPKPKKRTASKPKSDTDTQEG